MYPCRYLILVAFPQATYPPSVCPCWALCEKLFEVSGCITPLYLEKRLEQVKSEAQPISLNVAEVNVAALFFLSQASPQREVRSWPGGEGLCAGSEKPASL